MEIDKIKIAAQNDLKERISELKKLKRLSEVRNGFSNLIDNTSHLTRNKLSVNVGIYNDEISIKPTNLATVVFLEEGILIKEKIVDVGKIKIVYKKDNLLYFKSSIEITKNSPTQVTFEKKDKDETWFNNNCSNENLLKILGREKDIITGRG